MEIRRLLKDDYDELIGLLDYVFSKKNGTTASFEADLPKMCVRDDERMGKHFGVYEDGVLRAALGIYPLPAVINGKHLMFSTVGNVATHPDFTGRGYMSVLLREAMKELDRIGADASRLGGLRGRYNRYGYETCGSCYHFNLTRHNVTDYMKGKEYDYTFTEIKPDDYEILTFCDALYRKEKIAVERSLGGFYDIYSSMYAWRNTPYLICDKDGKRVGYLCAKGSGVAEIGALDPETACKMLCCLSKRRDDGVSVTFEPYATDYIRLFLKVSESFQISAPCHFQIRSWDKVANALFGLKSTYTALPDGHLVLGIKDYGNLLFTVSSGVASCVRTDEKAELTLDRLSASRFIFGPFSPSATADAPATASAWFPLPLSWNLQDRI